MIVQPPSNFQLFTFNVKLSCRVVLCWIHVQQMEIQLFKCPHIVHFLSDPGIPGIICHWLMFCRLYWCGSGWWRYQPDTNCWSQKGNPRQCNLKLPSGVGVSLCSNQLVEALQQGVSLDRAVFDQKVCTDSILTSSLLDVRQLSNFLRQLFFADNVSANYFVASWIRT